MAPGPASSGIPRGTTAISSRSNVSSRSWAVRRERDRSPWSISSATPKRRTPPAILKAGIVKPNPAKIHCPKTANTPRVTVAVRQAFETMSCFCVWSMSSVRTEKKGTTPSGSTIAKMEAMAVAPNARSTMVYPEFGRSVLAHQLHPTATLVHGEVSVVRGSHEFVPGDDLELVAVAFREAQRARAFHLARLEPLHGGDLPCVLERDFLQCRHVSIPCSHATHWRRADDCTTWSLISVFRLSDAP